jgi:hypothetical protein
VTEQTPPTHPTPPPSPNTGSSASGDVAYMFSEVKVIRGREAKKIAEMEGQGWELVSQAAGTLRSELKFRKVRPKGLGAYLAQGFAAFRRLETKTQLRALGAVGALILVLIIIGIVAGGKGGGNATPTASDASTSAPATPSESPSATPSQSVSSSSPASSAAPTVTTITVDALLDKLNAPKYDGIKVGDEFKLTGELFESDSWGVGASGDYNVELKAKGGKDDLSVFVDKSDAANWENGTKVEMVVQMVNVTIDGDTTDGWLKAVSVKTLSGGTTPAKKKAARQQKLWSDLTTYRKTINSSTGMAVIDSIEQGATDTVIHVALNAGFATLSKSEAQTTINTMNGQIVGIANGDGLDYPQVYYFIGGQEVGVNHYLVDPTQVNFKGMLD